MRTSFIAVITLRKDLSETMKEQSNRTEQINQDMNSNMENIKDELKKDMDKINKITEKNIEIAAKKHEELFLKFEEGENNLETLKQCLESTVTDSKHELQKEIKNLGWS